LYFSLARENLGLTEDGFFGRGKKLFFRSLPEWAFVILPLSEIHHLSLKLKLRHW
jgi:hypothetical protein